MFYIYNPFLCKLFEGHGLCLDMYCIPGFPIKTYLLMPERYHPSWGWEDKLFSDNDKSEHPESSREGCDFPEDGKNPLRQGCFSLK